MTSRNLPLTETLLGTTETAQPITLEQLWAKAESYGNVGIFSSTGSPREKSYRARIAFPTIEGTQLEAKSEFELTLTEALQQAIAKAELIRGQFK